MKKKLKVGAIFQIDLPDGKYAYCRLYKDATIGVYRQVTSDPNSPPVGSRDFLFQVGIKESVLSLGQFPLVGLDEFAKGESSWPEPTFMQDPITKKYSIYYRGKIKKASKPECEGMEKTVIWDRELIVKKIMALVQGM